MPFLTKSSAFQNKLMFGEKMSRHSKKEHRIDSGVVEVKTKVGKMFAYSFWRDFMPFVLFFCKVVIFEINRDIFLTM